MDLNELFKDVKSINKEATMKENMRMLSLKDNVTAEAFRKAYTKLAGYFNNISLDSPESNLTEFSRNKLSGKMKATLSVSTIAGLKRMPIHFVVKASVPEMVETPEQVLASLEQVEGSLDKEVKEILEKQKQMSAYHNDDIEVTAEDEKYLSDEQIAEQYQNPKIVSYQIFKRTNLEYPYYDVCLELEFPDATHPDYNDFVVEWVTYTPNTNDFKYDHWYPDNVYKFIEDYIVKTIEENKEQLDSTGKAEALLDSSSANSNITVQAKKKEIDLGVRENTAASQFPVKLLVYPKTYLPKLKKGDILNVGGFKYKYIGDEPTISGDTENGINARFELICGTKKASLNVTADKRELTPKEKEERAKKTKEGIEQAKKDDEEFKTAQEYLKGLSSEDIKNMSDDELTTTAIQFYSYGLTKPTALTKQLAERPKALVKYLGIPEISLFNIDEELTPSMVKALENYPEYAMTILKSHKEELQKAMTFQDLPDVLKKPLSSDVSIAIQFAEEYPRFLTEDMAKLIIESSPSKAEYFGTKGWNTSVKNPAFQLFIDYAESKGLEKDVSTDEELGLEGYDGYEDREPTDKELSSIDDVKTDISDVNTLNEKHTREKKQMGVDYKEDTTGLGLDDAIREEERRQELGNEEGEKEDILDDNDEEEPVKKKTSSEPELEKEAVLDDLSFTADVNSGTEVDFYGSDQDWIALLKEHHPQFKDIPNDWITIDDIEWYGSIPWTVDFDARDWGLKSMYISCKPSEIRAELHVDWYENSESADLDNSTDDYFTIPLKLTEIDTEVETNIGGGELLFLKKLEVDKDNTALALF